MKQLLYTFLFLLFATSAKAAGQSEPRIYPPCLYPVGTAVGTTFNDQNDYALHEDSPDAGTYSGLLTLSSGTLALHSKPYKKAIDVRPIAPVLASGASTKLPKLRYQIETDKCCYAPGDTVMLTMSPADQISQSAPCAKTCAP